MLGNQVSKMWTMIPAGVQNFFRRKKEYPVIDKIVIGYVTTVLFFQILLQISPVITVLAATPLYDIQTYLGVLGAGLILVDVFTTKRIWQGKGALLLYVILALAAFSSVRMLSYGVKENLFKLCWASIQFVLVYSCAYRFEKRGLEKYIKIFFIVLASIWFVACCVSLYQYVKQIGYMYVVNPLAKDSSSNRQGFYDNRLFGIFYTLNHAAYISLFFLLIGVVLLVWEKRIWVKCCLIAMELVLLYYIILSGSRSAAVALLTCAALMGFLLTYNAIKRKEIVKIVASLVASVLAVGLCAAGYVGLKSVAARVPYWGSHMQAPKTEMQAPKTDNVLAEELLVRENLKEDVTNGRLDIWRDYVMLYDEIGFSGLSPGNYMPYIFENHPEMYIVEYIRVHYPDKYDSGIIYHVHSGYMMVFVSAGILGAACLIAFMILCINNFVRIVMKNRRLKGLFIGAAMLIVAGAISAVFDEGLFFQNNPHTTIFWFALGIIMRKKLMAADAPACLGNTAE